MLVVIDSRVQAYHSLATGVRSGAKVLIVDPNIDGIEQITQALAEHSASSLHIVCHGEPGTLYLGKNPIKSSNLAQYRHQLKNWQVKDILLYACNVAADLSSTFIHHLHQLTGATKIRLPSALMQCSTPPTIWNSLPHCFSAGS